MPICPTATTPDVCSSATPTPPSDCVGPRPNGPSCMRAPGGASSHPRWPNWPTAPMARAASTPASSPRAAASSRWAPSTEPAGSTGMRRSLTPAPKTRSVWPRIRAAARLSRMSGAHSGAASKLLRSGESTGSGRRGCRPACCRPATSTPSSPAIRFPVRRPMRWWSPATGSREPRVPGALAKSCGVTPPWVTWALNGVRWGPCPSMTATPIRHRATDCGRPAGARLGQWAPPCVWSRCCASTT